MLSYTRGEYEPFTTRGKIVFVPLFVAKKCLFANVPRANTTMIGNPEKKPSTPVVAFAEKERDFVAGRRN